MRPEFFPNNFHEWEQDKLFGLWGALLSTGTVTDLCLYLNEYMASPNSLDVKICAIKRCTQYLVKQTEIGVGLASLCHQVWSTRNPVLTNAFLGELNNHVIELNDYKSYQMIGVFSRHFLKHHFDFIDAKDVFALVLNPTHNVTPAKVWVKVFVEASLIAHQLKPQTLDLLSKHAPLTKEDLLPYLIQNRATQSHVLEGIIDYHPHFSEYFLEQCHHQMKDDMHSVSNLMVMDILMWRHPDHDITKQWMSSPNASIHTPKTFPFYEGLLIASQVNAERHALSAKKKL